MANFRIATFSFLSLIRKHDVSSYFPCSFGSSQDITALLDVILATVRFLGSSGTKPEKESTKYSKTSK